MLSPSQMSTPVAALDPASGRAVADPVRPTERVLDLLRLRAAQLR